MGGFYEGGYRSHTAATVKLHQHGPHEMHVEMPDGSMKKLGHADMSYGSWFQLEQTKVGAEANILVRLA